MVLAWILWKSCALQHERPHGFGMYALVNCVLSNRSVIMVKVWIHCSSYALVDVLLERSLRRSLKPIFISTLNPVVLRGERARACAGYGANLGPHRSLVLPMHSEISTLACVYAYQSLFLLCVVYP